MDNDKRLSEYDITPGGSGYHMDVERIKAVDITLTTRYGQVLTVGDLIPDSTIKEVKDGIKKEHQRICNGTDCRIE